MQTHFNALLVRLYLMSQNGSALDTFGAVIATHFKGCKSCQDELEEMRVEEMRVRAAHDQDQDQTLLQADTFDFDVQLPLWEPGLLNGKVPVRFPIVY